MILENSLRIVKSPGGHRVRLCTVRCDFCSTVYSVSFQLASSKQTHRCRACANKEKKNLHRIGVAPANKQVKCVVPCLHCGKTKLKTRRQLEKTKFTFCDSACQIRWQRTNTDFARGENAGSYKDGSRVGGKLANYGLGFTSELRRQIKMRDNFTCQECKEKFGGKLGKKLDVHHLDENKDNNAESNLITLCKRCHTKIHWVQLKKKPFNQAQHG